MTEQMADARNVAVYPALFASHPPKRGARIVKGAMSVLTMPTYMGLVSSFPNCRDSAIMIVHRAVLAMPVSPITRKNQPKDGASQAVRALKPMATKPISSTPFRFQRSANHPMPMFMATCVIIKTLVMMPAWVSDAPRLCTTWTA